MPWTRARRVLAALASALILFQFVSLGASGLPFRPDETVLAIAPGNPAFERTWARTDRPVAQGEVIRTWMWGPKANTGVLYEPYAESSNGVREVQYFDKSRMEITHPEQTAEDTWFVTNGLLVVELVSGRLQLGDSLFEQHEPAVVNVAGDPDDVLGPTYATFGLLRTLPPLPDGAPIIQRIGRDGKIVSDPSLVRFGVTAAQHVTVPGLNHQIASVFLDFMRSSGTVYVDGQVVIDRLFETDYYATGLPIAEAYWASVKLQGVIQDVLIQCFERRCLTYTPGNDPSWQVEAGNVGQHYSTWRTALPNEPSPTVTNTVTASSTSVPSETATNTATSTVIMTATSAIPVSSTPTYTAIPDKSPTSTNTPTVTKTLTPTQTPTNDATNTPTGEWFPDGLWNVGEDIVPGMYRNSDSSAGCYWQRLRNPTSGVIDENLSHQIQEVRILETDGYFWSDGCGTWTRFTPPPKPTPVGESACLNAAEAEFLSLINAYRAQNGLSPLTASGKLNIASYNHSLDMGQREYFAHDTLSPLPAGQSGPRPDDRIDDTGYGGYSTWAENIAAGHATAQAVFDGWRNSSGHNKNMLNPAYTQIGIGLAVVPGSPYTNYWTTDFANGNDSGGC